MMIQIAILGHGVVGSGVAQVLTDNQETITKKSGHTIAVKRILDLRTFPELPYADRFTTDFNSIVTDDEIRVVVETMGGLHPAFEYVKASLEAGKSVVTSNKELVAAKGDELLAIAKGRGVNFLFEASVGGGIPILRPLDQCLAANRVEEIVGILNGTTNFMLTRMVGEKMSFDFALELAQIMGYAERDPSADVDGHDACRKICILASLAFGKHVHPDQVHTEGIGSLTEADVACANTAGCAIKLIGRAVRTDNGVHCLVAPMLVHVDHMLSKVNDVFNAIQVRGNAVGDVMFYGPGAGKLPTASAVVADVIDAVKHLNNRKSLFWEAGGDDSVLPFANYRCSSLIRLRATDTAAQAAQWLSRFGEIRVLNVRGLPEDELVIVTPVLTEAEFTETIAATGAELISRIRFADL